jgi:hypothetical protein
MNLVDRYNIRLYCRPLNKLSLSVGKPVFIAHSSVIKLSNDMEQPKYSFVDYGSTPIEALTALHGSVVNAIMEYVHFASHDIASPIDRVHLAILSNIVNGIEEGINNEQN